MVKFLILYTMIAAFYAAVAQPAEHFLGKEEVMGSIPISSSGFCGAKFDPEQAL
jgi:hypothetical protein